MKFNEATTFTEVNRTEKEHEEIAADNIRKEAKMRRLRYGIGLVALFAISIGGSEEAGAVYTSNTSSKITQILTYAGTNLILIELENQSIWSAHPCSASFFAIDSTLPSDQIDRMYSRAMLAFASGTPINIGFDGNGSCADGYIRIHRIG